MRKGGKLIFGGLRPGNPSPPPYVVTAYCGSLNLCAVSPANLWYHTRGVNRQIYLSLLQLHSLYFRLRK